MTGEPRKRAFGPWMMPVFRVLARLKGLRGTALDVFGYSDERRRERQLIVDYEKAIEEILAGLSRDNHATAVAIAGIPEEIRGFGPVKARNLEKAKANEAELLARFRAPSGAPQKAAA